MVSISIAIVVPVSIAIMVSLAVSIPIAFPVMIAFAVGDAAKLAVNILYDAIAARERLERRVYPGSGSVLAVGAQRAIAHTNVAAALAVIASRQRAVLFANQASVIV
jgi:hypothetical protein